MDLLKDFCKEKAGGVLFMAGPQFTSEFVTMNRLKGIRDLLPVKFGDNEFIDSIEALASAQDNKPGKMLLVNHNMDHHIITLEDPALVVPEIEAIATDTLVELEAEGVNVVPTAMATRLTMRSTIWRTSS